MYDCQAMLTSEEPIARQEATANTFHIRSGAGDAAGVCDGKGIIEVLRRAMSQCGYSERDAFAVHLAVEEAIANAIQHGNKRDLRKRVRVDFMISGERLFVKVTDQGTGFDPNLVPDPTLPENLEKASGRGLALMRQFMTWIRFNRRGNQVTMCLHRSNGKPE